MHLFTRSFLRIFWEFLLLLPVDANLSHEPLPIATALQVGCPTSSNFCEQVLYPTTLNPTTAVAYENAQGASTETRSFPYTLTTKITTTTTVTEINTLTSTVGRHTTTLEKCHPTLTCGAVTALHQGPLRNACYSILRSLTPAVTQTYTEQPNTDVYNATKVTGTHTSHITTRSYPLITKTVPTKTVYDCVTVQPPQQSCNNHGFERAYYMLDKTDRKQGPLKWNLTSYKSKAPEYDGTTDIIGGYFASESSKKIRKREYDGCTNDYFNARGYIYAPQTGAYEFVIPAYLQAAFLWIGDVAYSGYNASNAFLRATAPGHPESGGPSATYHLKRGTYYPFRSAWRCTSSPGHDGESYWMSIRRPDGIVMEGEYNDGGTFPDLEDSSSSYSYDDDADGTFPNLEGSSSYSYYYEYPYDRVQFVRSAYMVKFGCGPDAKEAPRYPPWGKET